jgi:hypothetical protein
MLRQMEERFVPPLTHRIRTELRDATSSPDTIVALTALTNLRADLDTLERDRVRYALEDGVSFAAIARALGISRQAAHRRYRALLAPDSRPLTAVALSTAARATLGRARDEAAALGAEHVGGVHVILALIAEGHLPAPGLSIHEARRFAGPVRDGVPTSLGLPLEVALKRAGTPVRIDDLLRAAYQEQAARDLLDRLGAAPRIAGSPSPR